MSTLTPASASELAYLLQSASLGNQRINLFGSNSKSLAAGPILDADIQISTARLDKVLQHERNDLTISVEAGMRLNRLQQFLRTHGQMVALDPPFLTNATIGGVIATDYSGPLRRKFGPARDQVIGMTFATLNGKLIQAGGMVVKNVAGLDLSKLMIGSFGTLAALTNINLRVHPLPKHLQTFLLSCESVERALEIRNQLLGGVLMPWSIQLFSPPAAAWLGRRGTLLAIRAAGSRSVLNRYAEKLDCNEVLANEEDTAFWNLTSDYPANFIARSPTGVVVRLQTPLQDLDSLPAFGSGCYVSQCGTGTTDAYFTSWQSVPPLWKLAREKGWRAFVAFAPSQIRQEKELWLQSQRPEAAEGFGMMKRFKQMFDPGNLLNRSRLYGRL